MISLFIQQAIAKFESLVNQIQKNARDINQRLNMIEHANMFKTAKPKYPGHLPACKVCTDIFTVDLIFDHAINIFLDDIFL